MTGRDDRSFNEVLAEARKGPLADLTERLISGNKSIRARADQEAGQRIRRMQGQEPQLARRGAAELASIQRMRAPLGGLSLPVRLLFSLLCGAFAALATPELIEELLRHADGLSPAFAQRELITWTMSALCFLWVMLRTGKD